LEQRGHRVSRLVVHNDAIRGAAAKIKTAFSTHYSQFGRQLIEHHLERDRPDIVHVHNFFPLLSPSVFYACSEAGVPVVHTLHNFRLICPSVLLMVGGKTYDTSIHHSAYWSVLKKAYRNSYVGTFVVARMVEYHKKRGTWREKVDRFIALTEHARSRFIAAGLPANKIVLKPNFIPDPSLPGRQQSVERHGALFVGRLGEEKGIRTLVDGWRNIDCPLTVAGDGPLRLLSRTAPRNVCFVGNKSFREVCQLMSRSLFLVMPSESFEGCPMVLLEAYAQGLPVVASKLGGLEELVVDRETGLHFQPRSAEDLRDKIRWMIDHPVECKRMGDNARRIYQSKYTPDTNYDQMMEIYREIV
jgi:glycosyltransferase involved in cell wall biosynthesis